MAAIIRSVTEFLPASREQYASHVTVRHRRRQTAFCTPFGTSDEAACQQSGGSRAMAAYRPQALSVIGTPSRRVPYPCRIGAAQSWLSPYG
jgi:hypothetical protein